MTDINELTVKLKAAAHEALPANERLSVLPPDDIFDISHVEGEQLDRDIAVMNSYNEIANPANVLALTEALENYKAAYEEEARDKEVQRSVIDDALCKLLPGCQYMDPPDGGSVTPLEQVARMVEDYRQRITELEQLLKASENNEMDARCHVAELEARTLTVKLPDGYAIRSGHPINEGERGVMIPKKGGDWLHRFDVEHSLRVAGIKLQIEGE